MKNILCLAGVFFSQNLFDSNVFLKSLACFFAFSWVSSAVYILNDLKDGPQDRLHPRKSQRPVASGKISRTSAIALACVSLAIGSTMAFLIGPRTFFIVGIYLFQNVLYTLYFKTLPILEIILVSLGFVWRALAGVTAVEVPLSPWLVLCTFLISFFVSAAKRKSELALIEGPPSDHRKVFAEYTPAFLDRLLSISAACTIMAYALYCLDDRTTQRFGHDLLATVPFVLYGIFKYMLLTEKNKTGDLIDAFMGHKDLLATSAMWLVAVTMLVYAR